MAKLKKPAIKNPELKNAVAEWKENRNEVTEENMMKAVQNAQYIAPVLIEDLPEDVELEKGTKYETKAKFMLVKDQNGVQFFPAFTEWLEVLKWKESAGLEQEIQPVVVTFDNYASLLLKPNPEARGIVVDPKGMNLMVPTVAVARAKGVNLPAPGAAGQPAQKKVNMKISEEQNISEKLLDQLKVQFDLNDSIFAAYVIKVEEVDDPKTTSFFVVTDMANMPDDARKVIFDQIGKLCKPHSSVPIAIVPLASPMGMQITKDREPLYVAEGFDLEGRIAAIKADIEKANAAKAEEGAAAEGAKAEGNKADGVSDAEADEARSNIEQS